MKALLFIFLCIFGWFSSAPFEVVEATSQFSAGGTAQSGTTTTYTFKILAQQSSEKLTIDEVWVDSTYFKAQPYKQNEDLSFDQTWEKGDTIFVMVSKRSLPDDKGDLKDFNGPVKKLPYEYEGKALIGYTLKGKRKYMTVAEIRTLPRVYYP